MAELAIAWWIWIVAGLGLMALEAFTPAGFYLFFLGLAALFTGALASIGLAPSLLTQGMASLMGLGLALILRKPVLKLLQLGPAPGPVDALVGQTAIAIGNIATGGSGKAELRGTAWSARNVGQVEIPHGARCLVERVDGLTLEIRAALPS